MLVETIEHAGITIKIHQDEDASYANPRDDDGLLGYIISGGAGKDYGIGEEQRDDFFDPSIACEPCEGSGEIEVDQPQPDDQPGVIVCPTCGGEGTRQRSLAEYFREEYGSQVVLPLFLLDHSGITIRTGTDLMTIDDEQAATRSSGRFAGDDAGWDTSFIGFVFDTADTRKACGCEDWDADRIRESIEAEIETYDQFIRGEVYGYTLHHNGERLEDSCWGFIGYECVEEEAKAAAEYAAHQVAREEREARYWLEREVLTV